jgi:citronellol/citronellal dehydrogenase
MQEEKNTNIDLSLPFRGTGSRAALITGGSRGIGKAIALRLAKEGYNIAIASKTAEPHPKLEGTIYTAAKEIEALGVKCLPLQCDIRFDDQIENAVAETVDAFGGLDILVNNASHRAYRSKAL